MRIGVLVAGLVALMGLGGVQAGEDLGGAPGFSAESVTYREGGPAPGEPLRVYMSPEGRRIEGIPPAGVTLIAPAEGRQRWMVDPEEKVFAVDRSWSRGASLGGVLSHQPCKGFPRSKKLGEAEVDGRRTEKWRCEHPAFGAVVQWFDPVLNTVLRDRTAKGEIQELRRIQVGPQDESLFRFQPGEGYEKVPVIELFR